MLKSLKILAGAAVLCTLMTPVMAQQYDLGREATQDEILAWDRSVFPDGTGLPAGSGSVEDGEEIYAEKCAHCHGDFGEGVGRWPVLAGGQGTLTSERPVKTIGSYFPYLSTVYDYINRAMPFGEANVLEPDEIYAITAYLLNMNDLVDYDFVLSNENFLEVEMANGPENFYDDDREAQAIFTNRDACMSNCKDDVKITMRAAVLDVTPDGEGEGGIE